MLKDALPWTSCLSIPILAISDDVDVPGWHYAFDPRGMPDDLERDVPNLAHAGLGIILSNALQIIILSKEINTLYEYCSNGFRRYSIKVDT